MEEFTFPCVPALEHQCTTKALPFPHFASPSPWLVAVQEHDCHRRSFSAVEPQAAAAVGGGDGGYHHHQQPQQQHGSARYAVEKYKMDMLWEDFNEELARAAPPCPVTAKATPWAAKEESWGDDYDGEDCAPNAETTRRRAVVRRRRMGILTMLRLLKKLFLAHKSGASRKAPPI